MENSIGSKLEKYNDNSSISNKDIVNCYFIQSADERIKRIIECISKAEKRIYILSSLSRTKTTQTTQHKNYLFALNDILENKSNVDFLRIIVPPQSLSNALKNKQELINRIKEFEPYDDHFNIINEFREKSLIALPDGPRGISILFIDDRFLFLIIAKDYKEKLLSDLLEGGFFFENLTMKLAKRFYECFQGLKKDGIIIE